jgi:poly-gamma-glutamate synthesis protein (capsule biosynthesis protein)
VSPLRYSSILKDLDALPENAAAILYFHWGREHVSLPPPGDVHLARALLLHKKVAGIIGTHAHRVQGYIEEGEKRAYFSLGNFLFPNFFIEPPTRISYPTAVEKGYKVTRRYHSVEELTYKKWRFRNRISIVVTYDTETGAFRHTPVIQADNEPVIRDLRGLAATFVCGWIKALSLLYRLPDWAYSPLECLHRRTVRYFWNAGIWWYGLRQKGLPWLFKRALFKLRKRLTATAGHQEV